MNGLFVIFNTIQTYIHFEYIFRMVPLCFNMKGI